MAPPRQPSRPDYGRPPIAREDSIVPPRLEKKELPLGAPETSRLLFEVLHFNKELLLHLGDMTRDVRSRTGKLEDAHDATVERVDKIEDWTEDTKTRALQTIQRSTKTRQLWSTRVWQIFAGVLIAVITALALVVTSIATRSCSTPALSPTLEQRP